jgi:hypothetical protein
MNREFQGCKAELRLLDLIIRSLGDLAATAHLRSLLPCRSMHLLQRSHESFGGSIGYGSAGQDTRLQCAIGGICQNRTLACSRRGDVPVNMPLFPVLSFRRCDFNLDSTKTVQMKVV